MVARWKPRNQLVVKQHRAFGTGSIRGQLVAQTRNALNTLVVPFSISLVQARNIISAADQSYRTLFTIALMTGIRSGELLGLQRGDLDFERRLIFIRRSIWHKRVQTPKSKHSARPVPMPEALAAILQGYLAVQRPNPEEWLFADRFGRPLDAERIVRKWLRPILDALGIPRCHMHAFRHTHSSLLLDIGAPPTVLRDQMRHSDVRTTLGIYGYALANARLSL